jgi:hypothetical protein
MATAKHDQEDTSTEVVEVNYDAQSLASLSSGAAKFAAALERGNVTAAPSSGGGDVVERDTLIGVPFMVTKVTYRDGKGEFAPGTRNDYISFEGVIPPRAVLDQMKKIPDLGPYAPEEEIVFNDGTTGLYRQMTMWLHQNGYIKVDETTGELSDRGKRGTSAFDQPREMWEEGETAGSEGIDVAMFAQRGLRVSRYEGPNGPAETYYFG